MADGGEYWYCHLELGSTSAFKTGDKIKRGQILGVAGKSGNAGNMAKSEEHLHLVVLDPNKWRSDPTKWLNEGVYDPKYPPK